jgi:hypothetical protein
MFSREQTASNKYFIFLLNLVRKVSIMSNSYDDQSVLAEFQTVAKALAGEIEKAVATAAIELDSSAEDFLTEEERQLASMRSQQAPPELERLTRHLREIGIELRARGLQPEAAVALA